MTNHLNYDIRNGAGDIVGSADSLEDALALLSIGGESICLPGSSVPLVRVDSTPVPSARLSDAALVAKIGWNGARQLRGELS